MTGHSGIACERFEGVAFRVSVILAVFLFYWADCICFGFKVQTFFAEQVICCGCGRAGLTWSGKVRSMAGLQ
eukprot:scaffold133165_cov19-Prasinocladus_malaysianus.AAC.1